MVVLAFQLFSKYKIAMNEQIKHDSYLYNEKLRYTYSLLEIEVDVVFSLLDNWQKINADPVCFGSRNDSYGAFYITKTGHVNTMKLVHKNGSIHCNPIDGDSYWTCTHSDYSNKLMTMIANARKEVLLPPTEDLEGFPNYGERAICQKPHFYSLEGIGIKSPQLVFHNLSNPLFLSRGQELQVWYGQDLVNCWDAFNTGTTCVDVYAWYI